jgi:lysophospholipase L1-like esterase
LISTRGPARLLAGGSLIACLLGFDPFLLAQAGVSNEHWVGTWTTAVVGRPPQGQPPQGRGQVPQGPAATPPQSQPAPAPPAALNFNDQTLRQIVRVSIGGERLRVVLSNTFGTAPLPIGAAHVALRGKSAAIVPMSDRALTFSGAGSTIIPPGAVMISDPVDLSVPPLADLAVDIYLPGDTAAGTSPLTMHNVGLQTNYVSPAGNHAGAAEMPVTTTTLSWFFLARVEVVAPPQTGALVAFGDSITDGTRSTPDTNSRWPNHFAKRLVAQKLRMGVLNLGISGNRVLSDAGTAGVGALARFDRDVLVQPGGTHVIVMEGINDIGQARENPSPTVAEIIAGHRQLVERARTEGLKIFVGTLTPFEGAAYWTAVGEAKRQAVNVWIRTGKAYDGVVDFDAALRDPAQPTKIAAKYDSGDHLHPNDAGYELMANTIDLEIFGARPAAPRTAGR